MAVATEARIVWTLQSVRSPRAARNVSAPRRQPAKGVFLPGTANT